MDGTDEFGGASDAPILDAGEEQDMADAWAACSARWEAEAAKKKAAAERRNATKRAARAAKKKPKAE